MNLFFSNRSFRFGVILATLLGSSHLTASAADRWTSLLGNRTVEADFIGLWGNEVVLELPNARRVAVDIDELVAESRIQARRMAEEHQKGRLELVNRIQAAAKEAAAPAPTPLPKPKTPPAYRNLQTGSGPMDQIDWLILQNANGHGMLALFDSLPPSYQGDLERLIRMSVAKLDMAATEQTLGSIRSIGDLVVTRQRWLFSYPRFKALPDEAADPIQGILMGLGGLIRDGIEPSALQLDELPKMPLRTWLVNLDKLIAPHLAELSRQQEQLGVSETVFNVTDEKDGKATLEITDGEVTQPVNLVTVEGMWMFEDLDQEKWTEMTQAWETALESVEDGSVLGGGMGMMAFAGVTSMLQPLTSAQSARDFHAAMDGMMDQVAPLIGMATQMANMGRPQGGGYNDGGYGGGDYDSYEQEMMMGMEEMDSYEQEMMQSGN